jgi:hypothetical protein
MTTDKQYRRLIAIASATNRSMIEDDLGLDCGILARYEKKPQKTAIKPGSPYFNPTDYQSRYTSSEQRLKNQQQKEIGFANELLTKFADFAEMTGLETSEAQNSEARQREWRSQE